MKNYGRKCEDAASYHTALDIQSSRQSLDKLFVWMQSHPETQDISKSLLQACQMIQQMSVSGLLSPQES